MKDFVTLKEAELRWCPMAREHYPVGGDMVVTNRGQGSDNPKCIGDACMAWRWSHQDAGPNSPPTGFCGAFGLPKYV